MIPRIITMSIAMFFAMASLNAQPQERERLESAKIAFITSKLDLSPEEAQIFWPIYNEYQDKERAIRMELRQSIIMSRLEPEGLTDAEYLKLVNEALDAKQQQINLEREYVNKLLKVIPAQKVAILLKSEREFGMKLIKSLNDRPPDRMRR